MELDLLGDLLTSALKYRESGFDGDVVLHDETTQSDLKAKDMFAKQGERYFMRQESIPGDLAIKAIAVDKNGVYLETAPLNAEEISLVIVDEMMPISFASDGFFKDIHTQKILISVSKPVKPEKELGMRCMITALLGDLSSRQQKMSIEVLDLLYTRGCFSVEDEETVSAPTSQRIVQRLELGLQQKLSAEQRPLFLLGAYAAAQGRTELRTDLLALLSLEHRILTMDGDELLDFIVEYVGKNGVERTKNILLFTIAGRIKRTMPKLTWKDARSLAKKMSAKVVV